MPQVIRAGGHGVNADRAVNVDIDEAWKQSQVRKINFRIGFW